MRETIDDVHVQFAECFPDPQLRPFLYLLSRKMSEGHICLPLVSWAKASSDLPARYAHATSTKALLKTNALIAHDAKAYKPFVVYENHLYLQRYFQYETTILQRILGLIEEEKKHFPARQKAIAAQAPYLQRLFAETAAPRPGIDPVHWQAAAVVCAALHSFSIITGGPGTGKTTTVRNVLALLYQLQPSLRVALAAPTGKAAMRIAESLAHQPLLHDPATQQKIQQLVPTTLHRLLGYRKNSLYFTHQADNPLPFDVVVVDECSMIDVALMAKLLEAIGPHTQLILLGDKDQLASVEAGSLFGDLCQAQPSLNLFDSSLRSYINRFIPQAAMQLPDVSPNEAQAAHPLFQHVVELRRSHRFRDDEGIGQLSRAVIESRIEDLQTLLHHPDAAVIFDAHEDEQIFQKFVAGYQAYIEEKDPGDALKKLGKLRVLCATRQGKQGLYATNKRIEQYLQQQGLLQPFQNFYEHRPVMVTENNYELGLFNGDTGIVRTHPQTGVLMVYFKDSEGLPKWVMPGFLKALETAFALTVHKSQGSEFEEVMLLMPPIEASTMATRELVYTGITRAKKRIILSGQAQAFWDAAAQRVERVSGIAQRFLTTKTQSQA